MSRTSLGQRNEQIRIQDVSSIRQVVSGVRGQEQFLQPTLQFDDEVENFLFMKDRYVKAEGQFAWEGEMGETFMTVKDDFGVCVFRNGDRYIGYWKDRKMDGMGIYVFHDEDPVLRTIYLGEFHQGRFHGIGKLARFQESTGTMIYYGGWIEGKKAHQGRHYYPGQTQYFGLWANDLKQGEGRLVFPGGEFVGSWQQDRRQGFGRLRKTEGGLTLVYEGNWEGDDLPAGKLTYCDGNNSQVGRYEGQLLQGRRHGRGCYFWRGVVYEGQFVDDRIRGEGTIKIGKTSFRGNFQSDQGVLNLTEAQGQLLYENGDSFEGQLAIEDGTVVRKKGVYTFGSGDVAQGEFKDNAMGTLLGRFMYMWGNGQQKQFG